MTPKLQPCPFCGSSDVNPGVDFFFYVSCSDCALGPCVTPEPGAISQDVNEWHHKWEAQAIALWNQRPEARQPFVIEAGSMVIGNTSALHVVIDDTDLRIYDGERRVWP